MRNKKTERILKPFINIHGYVRANLQKNNKRKNYSVHRLVAIAFIENPNKLPVVNHINGIKTDNRVENLEWCTTKENNQKAIDTGLKKYIKKDILQYDKNNVLLQKWNKVKLKNKTLGFSERSIRACCQYNYKNNANRTYKGYIWKFA